MYSYSDHLKAIELHIQYGKSAAKTIRVLRYPSKKQLRRCYRSYVDTDQIIPRKRRKPEYTAAERRQAIENFFCKGQCIARTVRELGYPSRDWLRAWVNGETPVAIVRRPNLAAASVRSGVERKCAVN